MNTLSLIRWAGGKGKQLNDLLPLIPQTRIYVEPFGGGCSCLLNRERSEIEVYNDLDGALVNLYEVIRGEDSFGEFRRLVDLMPYSREVFEQCFDFDAIADPVRRAVAFYTYLGQSFSGKRLARQSEWSRAKVDNVASAWFRKQDKLVYIHERVKGIQIECRDALDILKEWDTDETTFYCDPPYILESRKKKKYYAVEPGDQYHEELVDVLLSVRGAVVLSGYDHPIYHRLVEDAGWWTDVYGTSALMDHAKRSAARKEIVYRNQRACEQGVRNPLFGSDVHEAERATVAEQYQ